MKIPPEQQPIILAFRRSQYLVFAYSLTNTRFTRSLTLVSSS